MSGQLCVAMDMCSSLDQVCNHEVGPASVEPVCEDPVEQYEWDQGDVDLTVCVEADVVIIMGVRTAWKSVQEFYQIHTNSGSPI